jgi:molecular chaperone DnaK
MMVTGGPVEYGLGVDLGTTYTAAAVRVDGRVEVVQLGGRRQEIPSLVFVRADGEILIGEAAERRGATEPGRLAREFKRRVGDPVPILVGGAPYSAHALMARLLKEVYAIVSQVQDGPPSAVTVTHPANWGPYKRELLDQAVRLADIAGVRFRSEPEAAAIQYASSERVRPDEVIAVYDLGGGTFDAAVLRKTATGFDLLGEPEGIEQLGGIDFDEAVFGHVMTTLGDAIGRLDPDDDGATAALARLRRDCVEAKEGLSFDTEVMIPVALPELHTRVRLNRSEFEAMIAPALGETVAAMRRALRSAGVAPDALRSILLAGGSSRIPVVGQLLTAEFGRPVVLDPRPEHAIALGAAQASALPVGAGTARSAAGTAGLTPVGAAPLSAAPLSAAPLSAAPVGAGAAARAGAGVAAPAFAVGTAAVGAGAGSADSASMGTSGSSVDSASPWTPSASPWRPPAPDQAGVPDPPTPRRRLQVDRRTLLIGIPALAALGGVGAIAASIANKDKGSDSGVSASGGKASPSASATQAAAAGQFPTDTMLVRLDTGGSWPSASNSAIYSTAPGSGQRTLLAGSGFDILPQWSHDRSKIAFTRRSGNKWQALTMDRDGGNQRLVTDRLNGGRVAWSRDDKQLCYVGNVGKQPQLFAITIGDGKSTQLTTTNVAIDDPVWAPNGSLVAFWSAQDGLPQIFLLRPDQPGAPWTQLTSGSASAVDPTWSPDGKLIAYTRTTEPAKSDIWVMNMDGTGQRALTSGADRDMDPTWSPNGSWIAFTRGTLDAPRIFAVRVDGTGLRQVTVGNVREGHPSWS